MDIKIEAIKDKLRKLIAKESSARELKNLAEADAFASKIQELMIEYELEMHDLLGGTNRVHTVIDVVFDTTDITQRHESNWIATLYCSIAESCFCKGFYLAGHREAAPMRVKIYGDETNIEMLHLLCAQLSTKLRELSRRAFSEYEGSSKRNTFIRSFYKGACAGVRERLLRDKHRAEDSTKQVYALVLDKMAAVNKYIGEQNITVKSAKGTRSSSIDGYLQGKAAGTNVDMSKSASRSNRLGSSPKLLGN